MSRNYGTAAANWWAEKITEENYGYEPHNIDNFKEALADAINKHMALNAHMVISTNKKSDNNLLMASVKTKMFAKIPSGYEMGIYGDTGISVFDNIGLLIFSA